MNVSIKLSLTFVLLLWVYCSGCQSTQTSETKPGYPNIIFILADDLGYGDLSCYGQSKFQTPNIDALARAGMRFTQHYSGSTVCAPSRSVLMTGRHTGNTSIRGNKEVQPEGQHPLDSTVVTLAELLKERGYATGAFGKWGLGFPGSQGDPIEQGFDEFFGYNCQRIGHNYYPYSLWHNDQVIMLEENAGDQEGLYAPAEIHERTLEFIEANRSEPFFAFVPSIIPHAELKAPDRYMEKYRGKFEPELEYTGCDPGCEYYKIGGYGSQKESHAAFVAMIDILDEQVGEIVSKVNDLGIADRTLIIFTSDNGPHREGGADPDYFDSNAGLRGYKRDLYEGGIRVPFIAVWPDKIEASSTSDHVSAFWDIYPTVAELVELRVSNQIDGISLLPTLLGNEQQVHDYLYWEFHERGGRRAVRRGDWKLVQYDVKNENPGPYELYDLSTDQSEQNDKSGEMPELVEELRALFDRRTISPVEAWNF